MNKNSPGAASGLYWQKTGKKRMPLAENLLREHECRCVAACHRFIKRGSSPTAVWNLHDRDGDILALLLYSNRNLLPVFCGHTAIPDPKFLKKIFRLLPVHSAQGLAADIIFLEGYLAKCGLEASDKIDYHLMCINDLSELNEACLQPPGPNSQRGTAVPPLSTLILREAQNGDRDALAELQAGYEQEEVLPAGAIFYPAVSRSNMDRIFADEQLLVAEIGGRLVGKINTSALSFTRFQIGGVYVHPDFRSMGIAQRMTAQFVKTLLEQKKGVSLFVKKSNSPAITVYRRLGFKTLADYRITYY